MDNKRLFSIICFAIVMLQCISLSSAFEFDNTKSYDPITREVTITNAFGLGGDIGKARLNTPLNVKVGAGYQKVAEFELWAYKDYDDALKQFEFEDMKGKEKISRDYDLKYLTYEEVEVGDFKSQCWESANKTEQCGMIQVGSHKESRGVWNKITSANLKKSERLTIGVFTEVQKGDFVDWIPMIYGVEVDEWATWTESMNVDIVSHYAMDGSGTPSPDSLETYDGAVTGTTSVTGLISNARNFTEAGDIIDFSSIWGLSNTENYTISGWVKQDEEITTGTREIWDGQYPIGSYFQLFYEYNGGTERLHYVQGGSDNVYNVELGIDWVHIIVQRQSAVSLLWVNGINVANGTAGDGGGAGTDVARVGIAWLGQIDELAVWKRVINVEEVALLYNGGDGLTINGSSDHTPDITLNSPSSANYTSIQELTINFSASDDVDLRDVKLYVNDILNQTNASGINDTYYYFDLELGDGDWGIYGKATDNESQETISNVINITIDTSLPTISTALNLTDIVTFNLPQNSTWNYTASDENIDSCYYNTTDHATQVITCNSSITDTQWATGGNKTITYCANDTLGLESCRVGYVYVYALSYEQSDTPDPIVEGNSATFNLTVNLTDTPTQTAYLVLNDTTYTATETAGVNGYYFERSVAIPTGWGNSTGNLIDWHWDYSIDGVVDNQTTDTTNITVYELAIDDCSTYGEVILNFSLRDEEATTFVNASAGSNVEIDLILTHSQNSSVTITYNNTWVNDDSPAVCIPNNILNSSTYWINFTVGFSSTDHVWEFYYMDGGTLNSTKIYEDFNGLTDYTIDLMDLLTADSTSFLFNYFDKDGLPVDNAVVHVMRKYIGEGTFREVERAKADDNGDTIVHLVEEDVIYYFMITQHGNLLYTSSEYTALCQATPCTLQLEASGGVATFPTDWDLIDGGAYIITSSPSTRNITLTYTNNETTEMNLTIYKYDSDGSYNAIKTGSDTGTSGEIILSVPQVAGNISFFATVIQEDEFINSEWINFEEDARDRFGVTLAVFLGAMIILTLGLFAVSEGVGTIVYVILGIIVSGALGLIVTDLSTGVNIIIYLVLAGGILIWKLTGGRK